MNEQVTVRLPVELRRALSEAAQRSQRKTSEIVRLALADYLGLAATARRGAGRPADRVRALLGSLESGIPDLAARHRDHLLAAIRRGG